MASNDPSQWYTSLTKFTFTLLLNEFYLRLGLLRWSLQYQDGTSDTPDVCHYLPHLIIRYIAWLTCIWAWFSQQVKEMDADRKKWLEEAMAEVNNEVWNCLCPALPSLTLPDPGCDDIRSPRNTTARSE